MKQKHRQDFNRASEIIAEAHAEGSRSNRSWYEAPPARLIDAEPASAGADTAPEDASPASGAPMDT